MDHQNLSQLKPKVKISSYAPSSRNNQQLNETELATRSDISTNLFNSVKSRASITYHQLATIVDSQSTNYGAQQGDSNQAPELNRLNKLRLAKYLNQIRGPTGSVRGHRDVVRRSLENIRSADTVRNFSVSQLTSFRSKGYHADGQSRSLENRLLVTDFDYLGKLIGEEEDQCVAYITSLGVIRRTFEDSKLMKSILELNLIRFEERDIYLNREFREQLKMRCKSIKVPALFVGGQLFGGIKELELLNESGKISVVLSDFKMQRTTSKVCSCCGNAKFIACQICHGSRKSMIRHFKFNSIALRCIKCDQNGGLVPCPKCTLRNENNNNNSDVTLVD